MQMGMRALLAIAAASLVACTGAVDSTDPAPTPPAVAVPAPAAPAPTSDVDHAHSEDSVIALPGAPSTDPAGFVCRKGAFCEDFEERGYGARWTNEVTTGRASIELGSDSASLGTGSLRLSAHDDSSSAYLFQAKGDVGADWSGVFGFAFRADEVPSKNLGLSELTVKTEDGPITLRISMRPEGLVLEQLGTADCLRDRCAASSKVIAPSKPNHWYRVKINMSVTPNQAPPYGRLEASVDDTTSVITELTVPFYNGAVFMSAGITKGDPVRRADIDLDDVSLLLRPR